MFPGCSITQERPTGSEQSCQRILHCAGNGKVSAIVSVLVVHTFVPLSIFSHGGKIKTVRHLIQNKILSSIK